MKYTIFYKDTKDSSIIEGYKERVNICYQLRSLGDILDIFDEAYDEAYDESYLSYDLEETDDIDSLLKEYKENGGDVIYVISGWCEFIK